MKANTELQLSLSFSAGLSRRGVPASASFRTWIAATLAHADVDGGIVDLRIVDAEEGRELNLQWRDKDYATNVLSFPSDMQMAGAGAPAWLGDIALCAPVVLQEARQQGKAARDHWAHLTVHGVLHLLGHDHQDDEQAQQMENLERRILAGLSIADPYRPSESLLAATQGDDETADPL